MREVTSKEYLERIGFKTNDIESMISTIPILEYTYSNELHKVVLSLIELGMDGTQIKVMILSNPYLLLTDRNKIKEIAAYLKKDIKLSDVQVRYIIEEYPSILTTDISNIIANKLLLEANKFKGLVLKDIVDTNPYVLIIDTKDLQENINQLIKLGKLEDVNDDATLLTNIDM